MQFTKQWRTVLATVTVFALSPTLASAEEMDPKNLLDKMSAIIADLDSFRIDGDAYADARLPAGQIIEHSARVTARVVRPGAIRLTTRSTEETKEIYFSDGHLTVFSEPRLLYGQVEIPPGIDSALDFAINELGIDAPLIDFLFSDVAGQLLADAEQIDYLGTELVRNRAHHHVAFRNPEVDVQIWLSTEGPLLPGKMSISSKWEGGAPRFVIFMDWNLNPDIPEGKLRFVPPEGATQIEILNDLID